MVIPTFDGNGNLGVGVKLHDPKFATLLWLVQQAVQFVVEMLHPHLVVVEPYGVKRCGVHARLYAAEQLNVLVDRDCHGLLAG